MKQRLTILAFAILTLGLTSSVYANTAGNDGKEELKIAEKAAKYANWEVLGENLNVALASKNQGVKQAAMRMVIQFGKHLDVNQSVYEIVRVYRNHEDDNMRRLAVVTLAHMNNSWAIDFLKRSIPFEKTERIKRTIQAVVAKAIDNRA